MPNGKRKTRPAKQEVAICQCNGQDVFVRDIVKFVDRNKRMKIGFALSILDDMLVVSLLDSHYEITKLECLVLNFGKSITDGYDAILSDVEKEYCRRMLISHEADDDEEEDDD